MRNDVLLNNKFAKENFRAYIYAWKMQLVEFITVIAFVVITVIVLNNAYGPVSNYLELFLVICLMIFLYFLYFLFLSEPIIKMKIDLKKEDVIFKKIKVEDIKTDLSGTKDGRLADVVRLYPIKMNVKKNNIIFIDNRGKKRKLRMIMSTKKALEISRFLVEEKELPVYYLRQSGMIIAIDDPQASCQENLYYRTLNSML